VLSVIVQFGPQGHLISIIFAGCFGFKEVGGSEKYVFFLLKNENLCVSFPVFGW